MPARPASQKYQWYIAKCYRWDLYILFAFPNAPKRSYDSMIHFVRARWVENLNSNCTTVGTFPERYEYECTVDVSTRTRTHYGTRIIAYPTYHYIHHTIESSVIDTTGGVSLSILLRKGLFTFSKNGPNDIRSSNEHNAELLLIITNKILLIVLVVVQPSFSVCYCCWFATQ